MGKCSFLQNLERADIEQQKDHIGEEFCNQKILYSFRAHGLINVICHLREHNLDFLFPPNLLGSQACESTFSSSKKHDGNEVNNYNF